MSRSFRVGVFIMATLAILLTGIFIIGSKQFFLHSTYRIETHFQNVVGLQEGADVRVGGIHVGTIKSIILPTKPTGQVTVVMEMQRNTRGVVNRGSTASIQSEGLLGDKYVEVSFGQEGAGQLRNGDTIQSQPPIQIAELIGKASEILGNADSAVRNLDAISSDFQSVASKINSGKGTVGALVNDRSMYQKANAAVSNFQDDTEALKHSFLLRGFFRQRGYEDESELTKDAIAAMPVGTPLKQFSYDASKIFGKHNQDARLKDSKPLNEAGHFLESNSFGLAVVAVSTGRTGDTDQDRKVAEARAAMVREYLAGHFHFDDTRLKTLAVGKSAEEGDQGKVEIAAFPPAQAGRGTR